MNFQTPHHIAQYMRSLIPKGVHTVLEPSPGEGNLVEVLQEKYEVMAPGDFFLLGSNQRFDCVVMNPPFTDKDCDLRNSPGEVDLRGAKTGYYFLSRAMKMSDNVIALMPWHTITNSASRAKGLKDWGLISLTSLPRSVFPGARVQCCILQLQKGYKEDTRFVIYS